MPTTAKQWVLLAIAAGLLLSRAPAFSGTPGTQGTQAGTSVSQNDLKSQAAAAIKHASDLLSQSAPEAGAAPARSRSNPGQRRAAQELETAQQLFARGLYRIALKHAKRVELFLNQVPGSPAGGEER